jgi:hypothetical protein
MALDTSTLAPAGRLTADGVGTSAAELRSTGVTSGVDAEERIVGLSGTGSGSGAEDLSSPQAYIAKATGRDISIFENFIYTSMNNYNLNIIKKKGFRYTKSPLF